MLCACEVGRNSSNNSEPLAFSGAPAISSFSPMFWVLLKVQEFQMLLLFGIPVTGWDFSSGESSLCYLFAYQMGQKSHLSMAE